MITQHAELCCALPCNLPSSGNLGRLGHTTRLRCPRVAQMIAVVFESRARARHRHRCFARVGVLKRSRSRRFERGHGSPASATSWPRAFPSSRVVQSGKSMIRASSRLISSRLGDDRARQPSQFRRGAENQSPKTKQLTSHNCPKRTHGRT